LTAAKEFSAFRRAICCLRGVLCPSQPGPRPRPPLPDLRGVKGNLGRFRQSFRAEDPGGVVFFGTKNLTVPLSMG
jgi:hypothetical protein